MNEQVNGINVIERIVYLASLVSEPHSVQSTLDKLRTITANSAQSSPEGTKALRSIEAELEDYLIHKEQLRSFTPESLQQNIERHFATNNPAMTIRRSVVKQIAMTVAACVGITISLSGLQILQGQVIFAFFIFALFVGLAWLLQSYKKELVSQLHGSLNYLIMATAGNGLFALNFPVIAANDYLNHLPLLQHGGFLVGAIPVYALFYLAFYSYATHVGTQIPVVLRPKAATTIAVALSVGVALLPHPVAVSHEIYFDIAVIGFAVSVYFSAIAAIIGFMSIPKTTELYNRSTFFLAISLVLQTIGNGFFLIFVTFLSGDFTVNEQKGQVLTALLIICALVFQYISLYKSKTALR